MEEPKDIERRNIPQRKEAMDRMKYIVLGVSSGAFLISVIVKLLSPLRGDIRDVTTVFIVMCGFVFGSNVASLFIKKE